MSKQLNHLKETIKHAHDPAICIEKVTGRIACNEPFLNAFSSGYGLNDIRLLVEKTVIDPDHRKDLQSEIEHLLNSSVDHHREIILKDILFENINGEECNKNVKIASYLDGVLVVLEEDSFNQFTKEAFDTLPELIIFINDKKEIIFSNNAAQNLLNIYPDSSPLRENVLAGDFIFFNANGETIQVDDFISKDQERKKTGIKIPGHPLKWFLASTRELPVSTEKYIKLIRLEELNRSEELAEGFPQQFNFYRDIIDKVPFHVFVCDGDAISYVNSSARTILQYPFKASSELVSGIIKEAYLSQYFYSLDLLTKEGIDSVKFRVELNSENTQYELIGTVIKIDDKLYVQWFFDDLSASEAVKQKAFQTNRENELLVQEIHHRVKNNLQSIMSFLSLKRPPLSKTGERFLSEIQKRIQTLTVAHELAIHSEDLLKVDLAKYLSSIISTIHQSVDDGKNYVINLHSDQKVELSFDKAIDCGLVINELIFNAIKHAFKGIHSGYVDVYLYVEDKFCFVKVKDNGIGLPDDFFTKQEENIGHQMVLAFVKRLGGKTEFVNNNGAEVLISFKI